MIWCEDSFCLKVHNIFVHTSLYVFLSWFISLVQSRKLRRCSPFELSFIKIIGSPPERQKQSDANWAVWLVSFTLDTLGLCRAFFLKGMIGPRDHGPTSSSSKKKKRKMWETNTAVHWHSSPIQFVWRGSFWHQPSFLHCSLTFFKTVTLFLQKRKKTHEKQLKKGHRSRKF